MLSACASSQFLEKKKLRRCGVVAPSAEGWRRRRPAVPIAAIAS
jgi:hypothetical protein